MTGEHDILEQVRKALRSDPRIRPTAGPIRLSFAPDGALAMEGEVDRLAGKKLALEAAARVPGVTGIVDRLRVRPATPMGDGAIRDAVRDALLEEIVLADCTLRVRTKDGIETVREPPDPHGEIVISVEDGVVTLDGEVAGLGQKRMAGVLAWWVPGSRDVVNGLGVNPPDVDSDEAITDAVRQVLEKDPLLAAESIAVTTHRGVVTLEGFVPSEDQRHMAEDDAWAVFGVDGVVNRLEVRP
ncbi:BON domain-containing protein [Caldovatus aquaticus]|uniref:BON domain-containing protein n=1 Tax=Caldovatus aquaticus TaxID=2865671 RepID=A0ABS7EXE8_9PROT|nr:BON domain-containing protein [Caldovatus aquaticus]MBW8267938.1 BON domain-containing protein [Caldovatus aquaticus]